MNMSASTKPHGRQYPSVFAIAVVFGGVVGMVIASLLQLSTGIGFLLGFVVVFLSLGTAVVMARQRKSDLL